MFFEIDKGDVSVSDYTVEISNLPRFATEKVVEDFIS